LNEEPIGVALSMLTLVPGGMGGSETYARALTREFATTSELSATAFVPSNAAGFSEGISEYVVSRVTTGSTTARRLGAVLQATISSRSIRRYMAEADVVHYPFTVAVPSPGKNQALVQTLHDLQHLDMPHLFSKPEQLFRRRNYEGTARKADAVVTISKFAKERAVHFLGLEPEKVHVAYLGVDTSQYVPNYGPREDFVLYPARGWAHKNHSRLVRAMEIVRVTHPELRLVLTGGGLDSLGALPEWVDRKGLVTQAELHSLYRSARVMAFPSLYEGFGLPPLEAMASGCPVAASRAGSIPEVCGDAAVLFDPLDVEGMASGILEADQQGVQLARAGVEHASLFTWEQCRDSHVLAYRAAIS